ncbi:MAG: HAMP domain-containing histidine kinase [Bacilli bacterium]|nr:HAMP domain-containing histidine kinase [Bacilli bacterium]
MKELNRKVFTIIFLILSLFVFFYIVSNNVQLYFKEYENVRRNLTFNNGLNRPNDDLDRMIVMDYEIYTVILDNKSIYKIINHSNTISNFNILSVASNIIKNNRVGLHIGNLYYNKYSYNYIENDIIVINTEKINNRLILELIKSIIIFLLVEILIYIVSKILTDNITKPAEESFEKQKDFIADASHELKTPLAVIMASADELKTDKKNKKYIDNIKYETERMNTLIKSLLDLSKLEKGINIENYKDENISKIIERICLTFEAIAFENNVSINTNIEENINFKCSKEEIEKLISIIIDNAIKHSYKDSSIKVLVNSDKLGINIEVTNNGDPIKSGDEEKIFERFYRADKSRKRESNRYGLGLAIAKNIVLNHNGTIKAYSKDNFTTFKVNLKK